MSIKIFITLTKKKGEDYSIPSRNEGGIVMMTKKWRRRWEAVGEKLTFIFGPPIILLLRLIPLSGVYLLGRFFASLVDIFPGRRKKIALANLRLVFGTRKGAEEISAIYRECLTRTVTSFLEAMKFCLLPIPVAKGLIEIVGKEHLDATLKRGKGIIIAGLHLGNFPLLAAKLALEGYPIAVIIKKPRNKYIARLYTSMTDTVGVGFIDGRERRLAAQQSLRQLRGGRIVYIIIDQNPPYPDIMVDFFGYAVPSFKGPVVLAMRTGATILPAFIVYENGWQHKLIIEKPFTLETTGDQERDVAHNLARLMKLTEGYIERYPEQWWWWHRRWKRHIDYKHL
jgi:KDO2-lipid IV(A) lauroyltransferase